ncbi:hypothetical protein KUL42_09920 [Alteromonas sp. KUL42]|uniref:hypothetical protein n=1 Tax=Alteromonas sp. KUL42 TaxID=2480797 RepID=UPI001035C213|nr:hypothetical protein [Alteromonas sp. KUL42]TAP37781.1 hypothetical protein EYR97_04930 [Alteromonas sp. KUL42]GEA06231.1 hypothetical protein KUL42_09920 [Alteromonas sp. KUL42]
MPTVVVGAAVAFAASSVVSVGVALAIGAASAIAFDALMDSMVPDAGGVSTGNQDLRTESNPNRLMIVGEAVTSGPITKYEKRTFNQKEYHLFFTPLAAHPCESVELYQLDGKSRTSLSGSGYRIEVALGLQTTANQSAMTEMVNIDDTCIGHGVTYAYHKYEVNPDIFPNGVQDVKFKVRGIRCYDPRLDSTAGGIGAHRADDESTWEWTDNAALINFYWKRFGGAIVLPIEMFDLANIALEANLCDEEVAFIDKNGVTHTEKRWTCNGVIDLSKGQASVEEELLRSCGARWAEAGGKFWLITAAYRGPATVTLTDDDLKDDIERDPYTPLEDRCNAVVAAFIDPESYYQQTNCTEIYSEYYRDVRDKRYLQHARELGYTNSDTMCQRLNRIYMERAAAGDTLRVVVGWKGIKCPPGKVINVNFNEHSIINKEYEVLEYEFDSEQFLWTLILKETTSAIFDDTVIPSERDLTPNTNIDNTFVESPVDITYLTTPNDSYRQGTITWAHESPESIRRYVVLITKIPADEFSKVYYPTLPTQDINNLEAGSYTVAISAENRFEKRSVATSINFNVNAASTPTDSVQVNVLPGRVIITGPTLPHNLATYEWRYSFVGDSASDFDAAHDAGENTTITITNTPHDGTVYIWYRIKDGDHVDPNWRTLTIPDLVGVNSEQLDPVNIVEALEPTIAPIQAQLDDLEVNVEDINVNIGEITLDIGEITTDIAELVLRNGEFEAQTLAVMQQERFDREETEALLLQSISENAAYQLELARRIEAGEELTNALIYRDPSRGLIVNRAFEYSDEKFTQAALVIDGVSGEVSAVSQRVDFAEDNISNLVSELELVPGLITARATTIVSESIAALEPAYAFNFFDSAQDWVAVNGTVTAGVNEINLTYGDIENAAISYSADNNRLIRVAVERLAGNEWNGTVIIERDDTTTETFENFVDESPLLLIDFTGIASYSGTITRLRLILGNSVADEFSITSITIGKADATTADLANLTGRVNQAEIAIDANNAQIAQRVTTSYFDDNAITFSNVEQTIDALESIIQLQAMRQSLIDGDIIQKSNSAALFINGQTGTIQQIVQTFEQDIENVETTITDVQSQIDGLGITDQVVGLSSQQLENYDLHAALLQQIASDLDDYLRDAEEDQSVALALNQLTIDVSPSGAIATDVESLRTATIHNGELITATNARLSQAQTDIEGNASAIEQVNLSVTGLNGALTSAISRIDTVEIDADNNATAISLLQGRASSLEDEVTANFSLLQQASTTAEEADGRSTTNATAITQIQNEVSTLDGAVTAAANLAQQANTTAEEADGRSTTNATAITQIQNEVSTLDGAVTAAANLAQQANTTAEEANGHSTTNATAITQIQNEVSTLDGAVTAAANLAQQANTTAEEADGRSTTNATAITQIQTQVNHASTGLSATNTLAQQAKIIAEEVEGSSSVNASAITQLSSSVETVDSRATSALTLATEINTELDDYRAVAQLAVDANGNAALIQLGATPESSEILFRSLKLIIQNSAGESKLYLDNAKDELVYRGDIYAEGGYFKGTLRSAKEESIGENFMFLQDVDGFGPDDLTLYRGPKFLDANNNVDYSKVTKANATEWRDIENNAYFGGSLSAGIPKNSGRTTLITLNPSIEVGPFGTLGYQKQIVFTVAWRGRLTQTGQCPNVNFTPTCTVKLQRKIGTGGWVTLQTNTASGSLTHTYVGELNRCTSNEIVDASWTFTDTSHRQVDGNGQETIITDNYSYRVLISNQQRYHASQFITYQEVSVICTEDTTNSDETTN